MRTILVLTAVALFMAGCSSYQKFVKKELLIPYVYMPPNNAHHPYTLFMHTDDGNFQPVCDATRTTGLALEDLLAKRKVSDTTIWDFKSSAAATFKVDLSQKQLADVEAKYRRINRVELSLDDGKMYTLPSIGVAEIASRIENSSCLDDVRIHVLEVDGARFSLPTTVFAYDVKYRILTKDGVDVTAELNPSLQRTVLKGAGIEYSNTSEVGMTGDDLYVGFRGMPMDKTLAVALQQPPQRRHAVAASPTSGFLGVQRAALPTSTSAQRAQAPDPEHDELPAGLQNRLIDVTDLVRAAVLGHDQ